MHSLSSFGSTPFIIRLKSVQGIVRTTQPSPCVLIFSSVFQLRTERSCQMMREKRRLGHQAFRQRLNLIIIDCSQESARRSVGPPYLRWPIVFLPFTSMIASPNRMPARSAGPNARTLIEMACSSLRPTDLSLPVYLRRHAHVGITAVVHMNRGGTHEMTWSVARVSFRIVKVQESFATISRAACRVRRLSTGSPLIATISSPKRIRAR
jgi:hypothetical protein